jgi:CubicO group peptidase (beta-lactamase class C family)
MRPTLLRDEETAPVPIHDWTRVRANRFHDFHQSWRIALRNALRLTPLVLLLFSCLPCTTAQPAEVVFPGETWQTREPQEVELDAEKLEAFARAVGGDGVVVRDGYLVKTWGRYDRNADWASSSKPVMSTLLMFAVQEKRLDGVDAPVRPWVRRRFSGRDLIDKDRAMTFRHLADMTSGYTRAERPGTHWAYNDYAIRLYASLLEEVFQSSLDEAVRERLAPLSFEDGRIVGSRGGQGVLASPRDFARIGWFWLNRGRWGDRQLLPAELFDRCCRADVPADLPRTKKAGRDYLKSGSHGGGSDQAEIGPGVYGFNWWFNGEGPDGRRFMPHLPGDAFQANGHWGRECMLIVPSLRLVAAARGNWGGTDLPKAKLLAAAVVEEVNAEDDSNADAEDEDGASRDQRDDRNRDLDDLGTFAKWSPIEVELKGPTSKGRGEPNPFSILVDATLTAPSGKTYDVPGYYDGDGRGSLDGDVWKLRFAADETGAWRFVTRSKHERLDGVRGAFRVGPIADDAAGFYRWGRLEAIGTPDNGIRYLKFRDGPYWLKAGCDDPENFLGNSANYDTPQKRTAAVDYLAERGVNSLYMMTQNLGGDDNDVWPWLGEKPAEARKNSGADARFDIARLHQWRRLFEHMQRRGVATYLVLEDDSGFDGYDHRRYYRELVARFGDLPAVRFNFNEEYNENYKLPAALAWMQALAEIDPYDHPRAIHNVNRPRDEYIDAPQIDMTSIQTKGGDPLVHHQLTLDWLAACRRRGKRLLVVNFDEGRPEQDRRGWWSAYLAGGVWETHVRPPYDRPMSAFEPAWTELGGARAFMESLPFWEMQADAKSIVAGEAFCLSRPGRAYALYLPRGGEVTVTLPEGSYQLGWWNPSNGAGGEFTKGRRLAGGRQTLTAPEKGDWAARILRDSEK